MLNLPSIMLSIKFKDIHQCEDSDHVYAVVRTSPWATNVIRTGELAPAGTMLVTPALGQSISLKFSLETRLESESFKPLIDFLAFLVQKL